MAGPTRACIVSFDASRDNEPFIQLPEPHLSYILTPPRHEDFAEAEAHMADPAVYMCGANPPHPYSAADWDSWHARESAQAATALADLRAILSATSGPSGSSSGSAYTNGCPVKSIRHVDAATGNQTFVGDLSIRRGRFTNLALDKAAQDAAVAANDALAAGDGRITWEVGYYVAQGHRGTGLMLTALTTLLNGYAGPWMNARVVAADTFTTNGASRRLLEKAGFVFQGVVPDALTMPDSKGGGLRSFNIFRWEGHGYGQGTEQQSEIEQAKDTA